MSKLEQLKERAFKDKDVFDEYNALHGELERKELRVTGHPQPVMRDAILQCIEAYKEGWELDKTGERGCGINQINSFQYIIPLFRVKQDVIPEEDVTPEMEAVTEKQEEVGELSLLDRLEGVTKKADILAIAKEVGCTPTEEEKKYPAKLKNVVREFIKGLGDE